MGKGEIAIDDPRSNDVRGLLARHVAFAHSHVPPNDRHALDSDGLSDPTIQFYSLRVNHELLAIGAIKKIDEEHAELKSMHTVEHARGHGLGREMLEHLMRVARASGFSRVSVETGSVPAFTAARSLYASAGFEVCGPFGEYSASPNKTFMTLKLTEVTCRGR